MGKERKMNKSSRVDQFNKFHKLINENPNVASYAIQLYEKSLLSGETLLDIVGFDSTQEVARQKTDVMHAGPYLQPTPTFSDIQKQEIRMEQARRNAEVLGRFMVCEQIPNADRIKILNAMMKNVAIMEESIQVK